MKFRYATSLFAFAASAALSSCDEKDAVIPEPVVKDKQVVFEVFAHKDYSSSYYANHEATIRLFIKRGDKETMAETVVFDTTFTKVLKDLPLETSQILINKRLAGIAIEKEWVSVGSGYSVGQEAYFSSEFLPADKDVLKVEVEL